MADASTSDASGKTVLSVGQCGVDGPRIRKTLESKLGVKVVSADTAEGALQKLAAGQFNLVMVNRELNVDKSPGMNVIRDIKASGNDTPVMLVSDQTDAQSEAAAAGAVQGFGKSKLNDEATMSRIAGAMR